MISELLTPDTTDGRPLWLTDSLYRNHHMISELLRLPLQTQQMVGHCGWLWLTYSLSIIWCQRGKQLVASVSTSFGKRLVSKRMFTWTLLLISVPWIASFPGSCAGEEERDHMLCPEQCQLVSFQGEILVQSKSQSIMTPFQSITLLSQSSYCTLPIVVVTKRLLKSDTSK